MGVICFSSLKGGVGKTTLSLNVSSAFAARGCETLLIDLDPAGHASHFLAPSLRPHPSSWHGAQDKAKVKIEHSSPEELQAEASSRQHSALAHLFMQLEQIGEGTFDSKTMDRALEQYSGLVQPVRQSLSVIQAGAELRHFLWGRGARAFKQLFPLFIRAMRSDFDYILIDTPPDYNVLTRNAIAQSDLAVVPVDPSAMSIACLEQLIASASHIKGTNWAIVRTMVQKQAKRLHRFTEERLNQNLFLTNANEAVEGEAGEGARFKEELDEYDVGDDGYGSAEFENPDSFIALLRQRENVQGEEKPKNGRESQVPPVAANGVEGHEERPIFLFNSLTYRSELQNRLSFEGKTCFDAAAYKKIAKQYMEIAREIEQVLGLSEEVAEFSSFSSGMDISSATF